MRTQRDEFRSCIIEPLNVGRCVHVGNAAPVPRKKRSTNVISVLVEMLSEMDERLRRVAEAMQEKYRPRIACAQMYRACTRNYVCYRSAT